MSTIMIIGESGSGKSRSLKNMNPETTFLIKVIDKALPFRGGGKRFTIATKNKKGNAIICDQYNIICSTINKINTHPEYMHIKNLVIDDFFYIMAEEFMKRASQKGFDKFNELAAHTWEIFNVSSVLRSDLNLIILTHASTDEHGVTRAKTVGKLTDKAVCLEGRCTCVFQTKTNNDEYVFQTQKDESTIAKSPEEMYEKYIPNDLQAALDRMEEYYSEDVQEPTAAKKEGESDVLTNPEAEEESIRGTELQEFSNFIHN